jgi:Zn-dependent peptidase ImmA (M78 family)
MSSYIAQPISRKSIRQLAYLIREKFDLKEEKYFPVVEFLEFGLPQIDDSFTLEIESINNMRGRYGVTYPEKNLIVIREDVYDNAIAGVPRDRFTIAHEIGHYIMHSPDNIALARDNKKDNLPAYLDPEWQANTFAGELLAPPHIIRNLSLEEISEYCGVSLQVAKIQLSKL